MSATIIWNKFELRPGSQYNYNHVFLIKNFLKFKKGEIIWANHDGFTAIYCDSSIGRKVEREKNSQHLNSFYRCAVPMEGTTWESSTRKEKGKFTIRRFRTDCPYFSGTDIRATRYRKDLKDNVDFGERDMLNIEKYYKCIGIKGKL